MKLVLIGIALLIAAITAFYTTKALNNSDNRCLDKGVGLFLPVILLSYGLWMQTFIAASLMILGWRIMKQEIRLQ